MQRSVQKGDEALLLVERLGVLVDGIDIHRVDPELFLTGHLRPRNRGSAGSCATVVPDGLPSLSGSVRTRRRG